MGRRSILRLIDVAVVALLAGTGLAQVLTGAVDGMAGGRVAHVLLIAAATLPLLLRRSQPVWVLALVFVASWVQYELGGGLGQPFFAALLALHAVGSHARGRALLAGPAAVLLNIAIVDVAKLRAGDRVDEVVPVWFVMLGAWGLGRWMSHRRTETAELQARTVAAEVERDRHVRAAIADERARIARELHDLVAHSLGVIVIQAQAAQRVAASDVPATVTALEAVESTGRAGLSEMRRLLGLLTSPEVAPTEPQPSLAHLAQLTDQVRSAGVPVVLDVQGRPRPLGAGLELTAYRIIQEALTNAAKHAEGAAVRVRLGYGADQLDIEVDDDGAGSAVAPGGPGHGLVGMRERVALYGGDLSAGPSGHGFRVRAVLPLKGVDA